MLIIFFFVCIIFESYAFNLKLHNFYKLNPLPTKIQHNSLPYKITNKFHLNAISFDKSISPDLTFLQRPDPLVGLVLNGFFYVCLRLLKQNMLTPEGLIHATILGIGLWSFLGFNGWFLCVSYLVLGSLVTKVKMVEKQKLGIAEKRDGKRGPENVWGSASMAIICASIARFFPNHNELFKVGYVAAMSTKLSDTFQSEIGKAFGKSTYLITTFQAVPKGTEGAVSLEGTFAGIIGSLILSVLAFYLGLISNFKSIVAIMVSSFVANFFESYLGATFQSKNFKWLTNELVNVLNTACGALLAILSYTMFTFYRGATYF